MRKSLQLLCVAMLVTCATSALATELANNRHVFAYMVNGAKFGYLDDYTYASGYGVYDDYYYIKADGGGLNQLHISTSDAVAYVNGQDTTVNTTDGTASGSFYIPTTGGRGYNDDIILMVSVKPDGEGDLPENLSVNIKASGYDVPPANYSNATYETDEIDVTYGPSDFTNYGYGLHPYKPGPGTLGTWSLPLYGGQSDFTNGEQLLFIDLKLGNIKYGMLQDMTHNGAIKVDYSISGLNTSADFNAYAWCFASNQGQGISWTQNTVGTVGTSSYRINYTGE